MYCPVGEEESVTHPRRVRRVIPVHHPGRRGLAGKRWGVCLSQGKGLFLAWEKKKGVCVPRPRGKGVFLAASLALICKHAVNEASCGVCGFGSAGAVHEYT